MQRKFVQVFAAIVAAGIIGTALTVLLWDGDEPLAINPSPTATTTATAPPLTLPPSATPTATPAPPPSPTARPTVRPAGTAPAPEPAANVDCNRKPAFCSSTTGTMRVKDDKLQESGTIQHSTDYSAVPNTTMTWQIVREGGGDARNGDDVSKLLVTVEIRNDTDGTWVIPRREVALIVLLDGKEQHKLVTSGADFEMRPGGALTARYDIPIGFDGKYEWRAKTSFYRR